MNGKKVVVTGAARGLGKAVSQALHDQGAQVAMLGRNPETLEAAAREVGNGARAYAVDVSDPASTAAAFAKIGEDFGSIDLLVNNAAIFEARKVEDSSAEDLRAIVETNLMGTIYCCQQAIPLMRKAGAGDMINISSESALYPAPMLAAYMSSKAGVEAFSRGLNMELRPEDIRVSVLRLGVLAGTTPAKEIETFLEMCNREGTNWIIAGGLDYTSAAQAIINMAMLPRDANAQVLELRSTMRY
jgi:NAD(P)-dependent dehydrogenase (short-subunit alcohol dehydrogenase family)